VDFTIFLRKVRKVVFSGLFSGMEINRKKARKDPRILWDRDGKVPTQSLTRVNGRLFSGKLRI